MKKRNAYVLIIFGILVLINIFFVFAGFDLNGDGSIDRDDIAQLAQLYRGKGAYNASYDFNNDTKIDLFDIVSVAKNISTSSGNNQSNTSEPAYNPSTGTLVLQDDMESYTNITAMGEIDTGLPRIIPTPSPEANTPGGWENQAQFEILAPGRGETGQALRINRDGITQDGGGSSSSWIVAGTTIPSGLVTHYATYWGRMRPQTNLTQSLNIKWFWFQHPATGRAEFHTHWARSPNPNGPTYWNLLDIGNTANQGQQPVAPTFSDIATTNGVWHRFTYAYRPHSSQGAGDGFARMWVDGVKVVDVSQEMVGVVPNNSIAGKAWCDQEDVDRLHYQGDGNWEVTTLKWLSVQTTGSPPWTMDIDDFIWWTEP